MDEIKTVLDNLPSIILGIFIGLAALKYGLPLLEYPIQRFGIKTKGMLQREEERKLLHDTVNTVNDIVNIVKEIQETHSVDKKEVNDKSDQIENVLTMFINEVKDEIKQFTDNRTHDRQQSFAIQKQLTDSIKALTDNTKERDEQISALMCGSKELLGSTIDQLYSRYVALKGVPETEIDEFNDIFAAYKRLNGNHRRDMKYDYVKNHLPVIPVETKLVKEKMQNE